MNDWMAALLALLPPLAVPVWVGLRARTGDRLAAVQMGSVLAALMLVLTSFVFDQPSYLDLALTLTFLSLPGTLLLAHFLERWL